MTKEEIELAKSVFDRKQIMTGLRENPRIHSWDESRQKIVFVPLNYLGF